MQTQTRMTPSQLKYQVEKSGNCQYFFDRESMKFFGDTMSNYGVRSKPVELIDCLGNKYQAWELYRKRAVKHGLNISTFFDIETFKRVHPKAGA